MLKQLVSEEGFESLYAGIVPVLQSLCISNFIYFYTFHSLKAMITGKNGVSSPLRDLFIGMIAGVVNVLSTTPVWVVNTRIKMNHLSTGRNQYDNLLEGLWYIFKKEGIEGLWSGTVPSLMLVSNPALQFMMYEALKRRFSKIPEQTSTMNIFMLGAMAKMFATVLTYPLQLIQTKLRHGNKSAVGESKLTNGANANETNETVNGVKAKPRNEGSTTTQIFWFILNKYGIKGLFRGLEAKLFQTVLTAALMFTVYEKIARFVTSLLIRKNIV